MGVNGSAETLATASAVHDDGRLALANAAGRHFAYISDS